MPEHEVSLGAQCVGRQQLLYNGCYSETLHNWLTGHKQRLACRRDHGSSLVDSSLREAKTLVCPSCSRLPCQAATLQGRLPGRRAQEALNEPGN